MLKTCLAICILLNGFFSFSQRAIDILHYKYEIELSDLSDTIKGKATITIRFLKAIDTFSLDIKSLDVKKHKGMTLVLLSEDKTTMTSGLFKNDKLTIIPARKIKEGDTRTYVISYHGIPEDGLVISRNKFGRRTFFSDNWPDRAHHWIPCVDDPADKASVEFIITAPSHYQVVSNGTRISETNLAGNKKTTHWKEEIPLPTKIMVIGVADFAVKEEGRVQKIPVSTWVYPENKEKGFYDYAPAKEVLSFFIDYIGPYPYKKLANVQSKTVFGGMENASAIFYNELYVNGRRDQYMLMAHEITHQWFGDMVTEKSFAHLWLSEGFANYLSVLYMEKRFGKDTAKMLLNDDRQKVITFVKKNTNPVVDTVSSYMSLLNANSYEKGCWALHMLRRQLGDSIFQKCIRAYYAAYAGRNADTQDLQHVFEKNSGKDLSAFFRQWLYTGGIPNLDIKWSYADTEKKLMLTVTQLQAQPFHFPLELSIQTSSGKKQTQLIEINQSTQTFSLPVSEKTIHVKADPDVNLLFEGTVKSK
jgi:aminopeptidase N